MTQATAIRKHLEKGLKLTPIQALNRFGCFRLASRISELKTGGMNITSKLITVPSGKRVAQYVLVK